MSSDSELAPDVPVDLIKSCRGENCVLFCGPGLSAQLGWENRYGIVQYIINSGLLPNAIRDGLAEMLSRKRVEEVAEVIATQIPRAELVAILSRFFQERSVVDSRLARNLSKISFSSLLTTTWDNSAEILFSDRTPLILRGVLEEDSSVGYDASRFLIVKLFGDFSEPSSFRFTADEYREAMYRNESFARIVSSMIRNKTLLFLGTSERGISDFFSAFPDASVASPQKHFALLPDSLYVNVQKDRFRTRFGVELLPFQEADRNLVIERFVSALSQHAWTKQKSAQTSPERRLSSVRLSNIGPFEEVEFDLTPTWNVLIGNNASGKSTILKAIALGLCGDDPEAVRAASGLLRVGQKRGVIELRVDDSIYRTELQSDGSVVRVASRQVTALQRGSWIVLGFPALRGLNPDLSVSYSPAAVGRPVISDILPLILGKFDSRVEGLKSWIIHRAVSRRSRLTSSRKLAVDQQIEKFFKIVGDLLPGTEVSLESVDIKSWEVMVRTVDGVIPIDQVSQGIISALSWVGTLLQRLYEVHGDDVHPERQSVLVIVDELEAHLHPEWQQVIVQLVKSHFPAAQVIATTHSPLVISKLDRSEVLVCTRSAASGIPDIARAIVDPAGLRTDQILTSPLFGLVSTRSEKAESEIREYSFLLGLSKRSNGQEVRFQELKEKLSTTLRSGETIRDREIEEIIDTALERLINPERLVRGATKIDISKLAANLRKMTAALLEERPSPEIK